MTQFQFNEEYADFLDRKRNKGRPFRALSFPEEHLSRAVDLRRWMSPVEEQGDFNTCSANAVAGICEYLLRRYYNRTDDVSRLFLYYNGQIIGQQTRRVRDEGASQRDIIFGLRKYGLCSEKIWPYRSHLLNTEPSKDAYRQARRYTVIPLRVPCSVRSIETCLHHQIPVLLDIVLVNNTGNVIRANHGYLPLPDLNDTIINRTYLHTILIVGYDRDTKHFIVRNSWGANWGNRGYFYMPYAYLYHRRLHDPHDGLWTIIKIVERTAELPTIRQFILPSPQKKNHRHRRR